MTKHDPPAMPGLFAGFSRLLGQMVQLVRLCCATRQGKLGLLLLAAVLALKLAAIPITVRLISWSADFYNALQRADVDEAIRQIGVFAALTALSAAAFLAASYLRKLLVIRWRRELTRSLLDRWLAGHVLWHMAEPGTSGRIDNPDQRIADDCFLFLERLLGEDGSRGNALDLVTSAVALVSYVTVLWGLSTFALRFDLFGHSIEIPRYMVWAAPIYVAASTAVTQWLGSPLKGLMFEQQRREGDFRFALARVREAAEPVALSGGETAERAVLDQRFEAIAANWRQLIRRELILGTFTRPYFQTVLRIPMFLALPAFLAGRVTLGGLMQTASAFQNVVTTLSWFIFAYRDLAELAATTSRLSGFLRAAEEAGARPFGIQLETAGEALGWSDLNLLTPDGRPMLDVPDASFGPGGPIWIKAPSGTGKTTLLRAIAGLWPYGAGRILRPSGRLRILPQRSYLPLGGLHAAAAYPDDPGRLSSAARDAALAAVGLPPNTQERFGTEGLEPGHGLSGGERQRLHLASLLMSKPDWAFLDEATSALDPDAETALLELLLRELPQTTFVIVSHRQPKLPNLRCVELERLQSKAA
jgi:putative ATP-binding cassette transporter